MQNSSLEKLLTKVQTVDFVDQKRRGHDGEDVKGRMFNCSEQIVCFTL